MLKGVKAEFIKDFPFIKGWENKLCACNKEIVVDGYFDYNHTTCDDHTYYKYDFDRVIEDYSIKKHCNLCKGQSPWLIPIEEKEYTGFGEPEEGDTDYDDYFCIINQIVYYKPKNKYDIPPVNFALRNDDRASIQLFNYLKEEFDFENTMTEEDILKWNYEDGIYEFDDNDCKVQ